MQEILQTSESTLGTTVVDSRPRYNQPLATATYILDLWAWKPEPPAA